jgi:hypothetical protein
VTVTIFTFDGTGAPVYTNFEISEDPIWGDPNPALPLSGRNLGGGFPQNVARRLKAHDSNTWNWYPIDYKSGFRMPGTNVFPFNQTFDVPLKNGSIGRALAMLGGALQKTSGKIVLCGLSQGAWICDLAWEEFNHPDGMFHSRLSDLVGIVTFGSPRRPYGLVPSIPGVINPPGQGALDFPLEMSFGSVPGRVADPPSFMQAFCQIDDAASDSTRTDPQKAAISAVAEFCWDGDIDSGARLIPQIATVVTDLVGSLVWDFIKPGGDSPFAISKWLPFATGAQAGSDTRFRNPHAHYNSFAYDAVINEPLISGLNYVGTYNATTNTPALSNSTGTNGQVYRVSVGGTRNFGSGNITLAPYDMIVRNAGVWQKATLNDSGGTAAWKLGGDAAAVVVPLTTIVLVPAVIGTKLSTPGGKTAVDLAVEYLINIGNEYASEPAAPAAPQLGFTWWQTPPD